MVVIGLEKVFDFLKRHQECKQELSALIAELTATSFSDPQSIAGMYPSAKIINGKTVVFKVRGNKFRMSVEVAYKTGRIFVLAVETHAEYDRRRLK